MFIEVCKHLIYWWSSKSCENQQSNIISKSLYIKVASHVNSIAINLNINTIELYRNWCTQSLKLTYDHCKWLDFYTKWCKFSLLSFALFWKLMIEFANSFCRRLLSHEWEVESRVNHFFLLSFTHSRVDDRVVDESWNRLRDCIVSNTFHDLSNRIACQTIATSMSRTQTLTRVHNLLKSINNDCMKVCKIKYKVKFVNYMRCV